MDIMGIVLLTAGGIVFILSFLIPMKKGENSEEIRGLAKEEIRTLVSEELEAVRGHVDDVVEEAVNYSIEKTERSLERLSNEKIMAINEYSDTVLSEIHKNHEEVMFLYDMLNEKHSNLKNTMSEISQTVKEARETKKKAEEIVDTFQRLTPETVIPLKAGKTDIMQGTKEMQSYAVLDSAVVQEAAMGQELSALSPGSEQEAVVEQDFTKILSPDMEQDSVVAGAFDSVDVTQGASASLYSVTPGFVQETDGQSQNNNDRIMEMYKEGMSATAIARELNLGVGEVKLVIDLYKNRSVK